MMITSHHFMSSEEVGTPLGRERLEACVFRLPVNGKMVPMCEVNTAGYRAELHGGLTARRAEVAIDRGQAVHSGVAMHAGGPATRATAATCCHGGRSRTSIIMIREVDVWSSGGLRFVLIPIAISLGTPARGAGRRARLCRIWRSAGAVCDNGWGAVRGVGVIIRPT